MDVRFHPRIYFDQRRLPKLARFPFLRLPRRIETPRLLLRPPAKGDVPALPGLIGDWEVARWLSRVPHPYTEDDARDWLKIARRVRLFKQGLPMQVVRREDNLTIGGAGVSFADGEVGYWFGRTYWGHGYATEAVQAITRFAFEEYGMRRLWAAVFPGNEASCRVLEKLGFHWGGTRPYRTREGERDVLYYRLNCWEWNPHHD